VLVTPPEQSEAQFVVQKSNNDKQPGTTINNSSHEIETAPPPPPQAFDFLRIFQTDWFGQLGKQKASTEDVLPLSPSHFPEDPPIQTDGNSDRTSNAPKKTTTRSQGPSSVGSSQKKTFPSRSV